MHTIVTEMYMSGEGDLMVVTIRRSDRKKLTHEDIADAVEGLNEEEEVEEAPKDSGKH